MRLDGQGLLRPVGVHDDVGQLQGNEVGYDAPLRGKERIHNARRVLFRSCRGWPPNAEWGWSSPRHLGARTGLGSFHVNHQSTYRYGKQEGEGTDTTTALSLYSRS